MIAYKVFAMQRQKDHYQLYSVTTSALRQQYYLARINTPAWGNPMFAFDRIENAITFMHGMTSRRTLVLAEVSGTLDSLPVIVIPFLQITKAEVAPPKNLHDRAEFEVWARYMNKRGPDVDLAAPILPFGTIGLSTLKIETIKRILVRGCSLSDSSFSSFQFK